MQEVTGSIPVISTRTKALGNFAGRFSFYIASKPPTGRAAFFYICPQPGILKCIEKSKPTSEEQAE